MRIFWQSFVDEAIGATYLKHLRHHLSRAAAPGTVVDVKGMSPPDSYAHALSEMRCAKLMIANAVAAQSAGYDAFVCGHIQDSGLLEARGAVDIPVIGLGESTLLHACQLGQTMGIVTINPRFIPLFERQFAYYGLAKRIAGVRSVVFEPGQILAAFDDEALLARTKDQFGAEAAPLLDLGADVIIGGGGIPMLLFGRTHAHRIGDAPVLDGLPVALMHAEMAVRLGALNGLAISRRGLYARAPDPVVQEFLA